MIADARIADGAPHRNIASTLAAQVAMLTSHHQGGAVLKLYSVSLMLEFNLGLDHGRAKATLLSTASGIDFAELFVNSVDHLAHRQIADTHPAIVRSQYAHIW